MAEPTPPLTLDQRIDRWEEWAEEAGIDYTERRGIARTLGNQKDPALQRFLLEKAEWHLDDARFLLDFFQTHEQLHGFPAEKQQSILGYLSKKAKRQLVYQLAQLKPLPKTIRDYVSTIDELDNVGTKGQVHTLIRLSELQEFSKSVRQRVWDRLEEVITYKLPPTPSLDRWISAAGRHPDIGQRILGQLFTHYYLSKGNAPKSDWLTKEEHKLQKAPAHPTPPAWLNKTGKRKFLEELERKVTIARHSAFDDAINAAHRRPLERIIGSDIPRSFIMSKDLLVVLGAYHKMGSWTRGSTTGDKEQLGAARAQLKPLLEGLLRAYVRGLDATQEYLMMLPGNQALTAKLDKKKFAAWLDGLEKEYRLKEDDTPRPVYSNQGFPGIGNPYYQHPANADLPRDEENEERDRDVINPWGNPPQNNDENPPHDYPPDIFDSARPCDEGPQDTHIMFKKAPKDDTRKRVRIYDAKDPIEAMQMGEVTDTCTAITGGQYAYAGFVNAIDMNKKVFYMTDEDQHGKRVGRTLGVLTRKGLVLYDTYLPEDKDHDYMSAWIDYFGTLGKKLKTPVIFLNAEAEHSSTLRDAGFKKKNFHAIMDHAVCDHWYDNSGGGQVEVPKSGYAISHDDVYVLTLRKNKFSAERRKE